MKNRQQNGNNVSFGILIGIILLTILTVSLKVFEDKPLAASQDRQASQKAFVEACNVFFHPRCINCHPAGDAPMISDTSLPHRFNVKRGPDGKGTAGMSCTLCHRDKNQPDGPPGVPNWHMPTESMPMIFQGKTPAELCRQLKDPKQNGGKTGHQIIEHLDADPLVLWGWNPGKGRTSPPMDHKIFTSKMREWITLGAHCPE